MSRARDIADTQDNIGGAVAPYVAGKNFLINGNFDVWQRGTSFANTDVAYCADRWFMNGVNAATASRETTTVPTGSTYSIKLTSTGASSYCNLWNTLEAADVTLLAGKTVTFSALALVNATFNNTAGVCVQSNTTANTQTGGTWTNLGVTYSTVSTSVWTKITVTVTIPTNAAGLRWGLVYNALMPSGSILYWAQAQGEIGSVATPFARAGGTIQGELAACQRYYYRWTASATYSPVLFGGFFSTSQAKYIMYTPVTMRTAPSTLDYGGTFRLTDQTNYSDFTGMTLVVSTEISLVPQIIATASAASFANFRPAWLTASNSATAYIGVSAEL